MQNNMSCRIRDGYKISNFYTVGSTENLKVLAFLSSQEGFVNAVITNMKGDLFHIDIRCIELF